MSDLSDYELMRLAATDEEDAYEREDFAAEPPDFEQAYQDFYDDVKLKNTTKLDW